MKLAQIAKLLMDLNESELLSVHQDVVAMIRQKQSSKQFQAAQSFNLKDVVEFQNSRTGHPVRGVVEKINTKTIRVRTESGLWNVSPTLLKKVA